MRNFVSALLVLALFLPAFLPIAPHEAVHAMYDAHIMHQAGSSRHQETHLDKFHSKGQCFYIEHEDVDHHIPTDLASYYDEFLHIDLKNADQADLFSKLISSQDFDHDLTLEVAGTNPYELRSLQKRGPPPGYIVEPNSSPIYLTTLRLLI